MPFCLERKIQSVTRNAASELPTGGCTWCVLCLLKIYYFFLCKHKESLSEKQLDPFSTRHGLNPHRLNYLQRGMTPSCETTRSQVPGSALDHMRDNNLDLTFPVTDLSAYSVQVSTANRCNPRRPHFLLFCLCIW